MLTGPLSIFMKRMLLLDAYLPLAGLVLPFPAAAPGASGSLSLEDAAPRSADAQACPDENALMSHDTVPVHTGLKRVLVPLDPGNHACQTQSGWVQGTDQIAAH